MKHAMRKRASQSAREVGLDCRAGPGNEPALGAHLTTARRRYTHHGVYVGRGHVIHYAGLARCWQAGPVEEVSLSDFALGHPVRVVERGDATYLPHEIVQRARSRLGECDYHVLTNNCEHFCNWCIRGVHRSAQVRRRLIVVPLAFLVAASLAACLPRLVGW